MVNPSYLRCPQIRSDVCIRFSSLESFTRSNVDMLLCHLVIKCVCLVYFDSSKLSSTGMRHDAQLS
ncbi:hypothetical protein C8Q75DRAFT_744659 [Abortiporus biennis]|nr:hypothetical protein C8Q75DRAFT_744659 [Abortiporus biennis]